MPLRLANIPAAFFSIAALFLAAVLSRARIVDAFPLATFRIFPSRSLLRAILRAFEAGVAVFGDKPVVKIFEFKARFLLLKETI